MEQKKYLCPRSKLAEILIKQGYKYELRPIPWNLNYTGYLFAIDIDLCRAVKRFWEDEKIKTPLPKSIKEMLQKENEKGGALI